jgi:hypothetical protein
MSNIVRMAIGSFVLGVIMLTSGCVVEPREGYYDHEHHRYYHEHHWSECREHDDEHCHRYDR